MAQGKLIGIVLLVVGIVALAFGINAANAPAEELSEALTGQFSDRTMLYLVGGAAAAIAGLVLVLKRK